MASATHKDIPVITLELSLDEATTLRDVCMKIAGHPDRTRRGITDNVLAALSELDVVENVKPNTDDIRSSASGGLEFGEK
jgi:hypothetical protein